MDCLTCKRHYTQNGNCTEGKKNCLFYEEEPRGKMIRTNFSFKLENFAETPIIKSGAKMLFEEDNKTIEMIIISINWINLKTMMCNVNAKYYENNAPRFVKMKKYKIVK